MAKRHYLPFSGTPCTINYFCPKNSKGWGSTHLPHHSTMRPVPLSSKNVNVTQFLQKEISLRIKPRMPSKET